MVLNLYQKRLEQTPGAVYNKNMKNIFITRWIPDAGLALLNQKGYSVDVYPKDRVPSARELMKFLRKKPYDAVLTLLTDKIDSQIFDVAPVLKVVSNYAVGVNNIDLEEARKRNVLVTSTAGASSDCVAEHTLALMLSLTTRLVEGDSFIRSGKFKGWSPSLLIGTDLWAKTLGLIGAGRIGEKVAYKAQRGFDMKIIYHDIIRNEYIEKDHGAIFLQTVEEVLRQADIVSLHVPLLDSTRHLINAERLKLMKPTAFLINTSRGPVVDEYALVSALQTHAIRGAGLDVFEFEPKLARGLTKLSNVVLTPHIASARESARQEMSIMAAQNIIDAFEGRTPKGLVK